jgi:hypothetical protein
MIYFQVEILNVIQDELTTVDTLQEELVRQQERSKTLQEEICKSEDDKAILRQELELHLGNITANQKYSAVLDGKVQAVRSFSCVIMCCCFFVNYLKKAKILRVDSYSLRDF